jgi:GTP-binding protein HflX
MAPRHDHPGNGLDGSARERVWLSAREGGGLTLLRDALGLRLGLRRIHAELRLPPASGRLRARLHDIGAVRGEHHDEHGWTLQLDVAEADALRLSMQPHGAPLRAILPPTVDAQAPPDRFRAAG